MIGKRGGNNKNRQNDAKYRNALSGRQIPLLILDNKWHRLFTQTGSTTEIERLTTKLNGLLKRQGKVNSGMQDVHRVKKRLMEGIIASMGGEETSRYDKKMEESKRLIAECNTKLNEYRDENQALPKEIEDVNYELMLETMRICYDRLHKNTEEIKALDSWIIKTRMELKKKIVQKQEKETANHELYSYMHDILGSKVMEIFDMKYDPEESEAEEGSDE